MNFQSGICAARFESAKGRTVHQTKSGCNSLRLLDSTMCYHCGFDIPENKWRLHLDRFPACAARWAQQEQQHQKAYFDSEYDQGGEGDDAMSVTDEPALSDSSGADIASSKPGTLFTSFLLTQRQQTSEGSSNSSSAASPDHARPLASIFFTDSPPGSAASSPMHLHSPRSNNSQSEADSEAAEDFADWDDEHGNRSDRDDALSEDQVAVDPVLRASAELTQKCMRHNMSAVCINDILGCVHEYKEVIEQMPRTAKALKIAADKYVLEVTGISQLDTLLEVDVNLEDLGFEGISQLREPSVKFLYRDVRPALGSLLQQCTMQDLYLEFEQDDGDERYAPCTQTLCKHCLLNSSWHTVLRVCDYINIVVKHQ